MISVNICSSIGLSEETLYRLIRHVTPDCGLEDKSYPPGPAVGHNLGDAFGRIVLLSHAEDPFDLSPVPDHVRLLRWVRRRPDTQRRTETPLADHEPLLY